MIPLELLETGIISRLERSGDFLDGCTEEAPDWFWIWRYLCSLRVEPGVLLLHAAQELPPLLYIHQMNHLTHPSTLPCLSILVHARTFDRDPATRFTRDVETPGCDPSVSSVTHFRTLLHRSLSFRTSGLQTSPPPPCPSVERQHICPHAPSICALCHDQPTCLKAARSSACCSASARSTHTSTSAFVSPLQLPRYRADCPTSMSTTIQPTTLH